MTRDPEVSVLLPVRDAQDTLGRALHSVARQSEPRFECIVVDDGSRDGSLEIVRSWQRRDARFRVLERPARGLVPALNDGLAQCRGRFVARLDADDWMLRDRLLAQCKALAAAGAPDALGCHVRIAPRTGLSAGMRAYEAWLNSIRSAEDVHRERYVECPVAHPTLCARRELLQHFGYRDAGWPEDYDLVLRMLGAGRSIGMLPRRLLVWGDAPQRLSRTHANYALDRFTECKAAHLAEEFLAHSREYLLWGHGPTGRALRRALARHDRHAVQIVEVHPRRIGQTIGGAPVIAASQLASLPAPRPPLVSAVSGAGPRGEIRAELARLGMREGSDFVCAA